MRHFLAFVLSIPVALSIALFVSAMWALFVVPLGAPAIGLLHAWGLATLARLSGARLPSVLDVATFDSLSEDDKFVNSVARPIVQCLLLLCATGMAHLLVWLFGPVM